MSKKSLELKNINKFIQQGKYNKALDLIVLKEKKLDLKLDKNEKLILIETLILKSRIFEQKGDFQEAVRIANRMLAESEKIKNPFLILKAIVAKAYPVWQLGELDAAIAIIHESEPILKNLSDKDYKVIQEPEGTLLNLKGNIYWQKGELDTALSYYKKSLIIRKKINNQVLISNSLNNIGNIYADKGDLNQALIYYEESLDFNKQLGNKTSITYTLNNIGSIYSEKGELDLALNYYEDSLKINKEMGNQKDISLSLINIGGIYHLKGNSNLAMNFLKESLAISKEIGNILDISNCLFELIHVSVTIPDLILSEDYLAELKQIDQKRNNKVIHLQYRLSQALILKQSTRMINKSKAQIILQELVQEEVIEHATTIIAIQALCELLIFELRSTGDPIVLEEAKALINQLYVIAQNQKSFSLIVNVLLLQANFALLEGNLKLTTQLLSQALITAEEKDLIGHIKKVKTEQSIVKSELDIWIKMIARNAPIYERLEQARMNHYLQEIGKLFSP